MTLSITPIEPAFGEKGIPIVFSTDDNYAPYLSVALQSLLDHTNAEKFYDIIVLQDGLSERHQMKMKGQCRETTHVSLRFYKVPSSLENCGFQLNHLPISTFYRLLIPELFARYEKVIYLDVDICVQADVAELYDTDLGEMMLGACRDYVIMKLIRVKSQFKSFFTNTLKLRVLTDYVNAGILLFNIKACRKQNFMQVMLDTAQDHKRIFADQDMLNEVCQGKIYFLDPAWNSSYCVDKDAVPEELYEAHCQGVQSPKIVHYIHEGGTSISKPWKTDFYNKASLWWQYALQSPYAGEIINKRFQQINNQLEELSRKLEEQTSFSKELSRKLEGYGSLWQYRKSYWKYKLLSRITFGKTRRRYKTLRREMKAMMDAILFSPRRK